MKKAVSVLILFTFIILPSVNIAAQQSRNVRSKSVAATKFDTEFGSSQAIVESGAVRLSWSMIQETNNVGFFVYRISSSGEVLVSPEMILGAATRLRANTVYGERYEYFDADGSEDSIYMIESLSNDGNRSRSKQFVAISGGKSALNLQANDFIGENVAKPRRGEVLQSRISVPDDLAAEAASYSADPDPIGQRYAVSRPGVKIGVRGQGLFRVTRSDLQTGGFNVNTDSNLWQLYVSGIQQAIVVGSNGEFIEFYGEGIDLVESDTQTYYLVNGEVPGKRIQTRTNRRGSGSIVSPNYSETSIKKERTAFLSLVFNGDAENWFGRAVTATATTLPFTVTGIDTSVATVSLTIALQGYSFTGHQTELTVNGHSLDPLISSDREPYSVNLSIPTSWLNEGSNELQMRAAGPAGDVSFFDYLRVDFRRRYVAVQDNLRFYTHNYRSARVDGFSSPNIRLFDITDQNEPTIFGNVTVQQTGSTFGVVIPAGRGRIFYAVENAAFKSVSSIVPNDPAFVGIPTNGADLVIIAHRSMLTQAEAWANYRRAEGTVVKVIEASEIYDEFSYGAATADSVKSFFNYAVDNWATRPRYALLIGDASYDPRNYRGTGNFNMVPTKFVSTIFIETGSDEALADFNGDGLSEIAIGRIPVRTPQLVSDILARQIAWESSLTTPLNRGFLFAFDLPNTFDFEGMSLRIRDQLPAGTPSTMIGRASPTAQADLVAAINTGKYFVNYSGHGTTGAWASNSFFSKTNVPQLTNSPPSANRSVFTMLTCLNGYFMHVTDDSLAESLLNAPNGGAVAAWASSGETTPDVQEVMALRFYNQLGLGQITRMGDLVNDAKQTIPGGSDVRLSWALIGDPMLKVR